MHKSIAFIWVSGVVVTLLLTGTTAASTERVVPKKSLKHIASTTASDQAEYRAVKKIRSARLKPKVEHVAKKATPVRVRTVTRKVSKPKVVSRPRAANLPKYTKGVEQWRPTVIKYLKQFGCYTAANEALAVRVITGESHGNPNAHRPGSQYYGLVQCGEGWVRKYSADGKIRNMYVPREDWGTSRDWRMNPDTSIRVLCSCISKGSVYQQFSTAR